jgi:N-acetylglutamate synthase-like GNAT family acetyltransferase
MGLFDDTVLAEPIVAQIHPLARTGYPLTITLWLDTRSAPVARAVALTVPVLELRIATDDDADALTTINIAEYGRHATPADQLHFANGHTIIAVDSNGVIGCAAGRQFAPDILELFLLLVAPPHRNREIGAQLLHRFEHHATRAGFQAVVVATSLGYEEKASNISAVPFYLRHGYALAIDTELSTVFTKRLPPQ